MSTEGFPYLSVILFLPAAGAVVIGLLIKEARMVRITAALFTFAAFALSLALFVMFDRSDGLQFVEQAQWIKSIGAQYYLGVDGLSLPMVMLTTFLGLVAVFVSWKINLRVREYFAWLLVLE
ncbi:MAG: NADH-quinone oxidoreductase subunit M, partial [Dehalococcoidia bacterium]